MSEKKILLVEDNEVNRRLAGFCCARTVTRCARRARGRRRSRWSRKSGPDLIVMDIQLPGMDGLEITRKLKEQPATAAIPVIAVTSFAMKGTEKSAGRRLRRLRHQADRQDHVHPRSRRACGE